MPITTRANFSPSTKRIIAQRAGYRCSIPACRALTIGPGKMPNQISNTGTACHIFSASPNGPRGQGGLQNAEIQQATNGIWMCRKHGALVDTNQGNAYPASLLISLKNLHESWVTREQGGIATPYGWIQKLELLNTPISKHPQTLQLGKVTLVIGGNSTGKSALCEWLMGTTDPTALWRWVKPFNSACQLRYRITYYTEEEHQILVETGRDEVQYSLDGQAAPYNPLPFRVIAVMEERKHDPKKTHLQQISELLNINTFTARNAIYSLEASNPVIQKIRINSDESVDIVIRGTPIEATWNSISHSEQVKLVIELALILAKTTSRYLPTLLVLEWGVARLDNLGLSLIANRLADPQCKFQSVIIAPPRKGLNWNGWQVAHLRHEAPKISIQQEIVYE